MTLAQLTTQMEFEHKKGLGSYYTNVECGTKTASGIEFDDTLFTCATHYGNYGKYCLIVANNQYVICQMTDHGPNVPNRIVDLSKAAMEQLNGIEKGVVAVDLYFLGERHESSKAN